MYLMSMNTIKNKSFIHPVGALTYFDINVVYSVCLSLAATLILLQYLLPHDVNKKKKFTIFIVMSDWFLLPSAIVQYQRTIKLLN